MRLIAFDTATEWCSAALYDEGRVISREEKAGQRHSELLMPMLFSLLAEAQLTLRDLDGLAYGMGPGSFTGLRIACGVAQGVAMGANLPVVGVSTLEALAESARIRHGCERVLACLDARMNEVYAGLYRFAEGVWQCQHGPQVCPPGQTPMPDEAGYWGAGPGLGAYAELQALAMRHLDGVDAGVFPHARAIASLAAPRFARGEGRPPEAAEPVYIRDKVALKICER